MAGYAAICGWLIGTALAATAAAPDDSPAAPNAELLLFLAEFGDADGRYVDPTTIGEADADADAKPAEDSEFHDEDERTDDPPPDRPR